MEDYSNLDKRQLERLLESLNDLLTLNRNLDSFSSNPPFEITVTEDPLQKTLRIENIENKRPPTQFGSRQRAHTLAYSAVLRSLVRSFNSISLANCHEIFDRFHRELNILYVTSVTTDSIRKNGRRPVFGQTDLHDLKKMSDQLVKEIVNLEEDTFLTSGPDLIKLYLTAFLYLHNRLVDATVDQDSVGRGEGSALNKLEELENSLTATPSMQSQAINYLSWLVDEEAVKTAVEENSPSMLPFLILGIYRFVSGFPKLSRVLSLEDPFQQVFFEPNLISCLTHIIFYKSSREELFKIYQGTDKEVILVKNALDWLKGAYRLSSSDGVLLYVH
jgi:hypothetical protein